MKNSSLVQAQVRRLGMLLGELEDELLLAILAFCMCISVKDPSGGAARPTELATEPRARYPGRKLPRFLADIRDDQYADFSGAQLMRQIDQDRFATAEQFDLETRLVGRYQCPAVTLSRVNRKLRNTITDQLNHQTRVVNMDADGVCSWTAGVDLDAVRRLMEYAVGLVVVLGGAVHLSMDDANRLYRVLAQRWDVWDSRLLCIKYEVGCALAYLPEGSLQVAAMRPGGPVRWRVLNGSRRMRTGFLSETGLTLRPSRHVPGELWRSGMRHVFPVDFTQQRAEGRRLYRRSNPMDRSAFFEHVLLADFALAPKDVAALTTPGTTVQTNVVVARLLRMANLTLADGKMDPVFLRTDLSCCFRLKTTEAGVACTCDMSWKLVRDDDDFGILFVHEHEGFGWVVSVREQATVLAATGDFPDFHRGGFGDSWQRRILERCSAGASLLFTALVGVCPISIERHNPLRELEHARMYNARINPLMYADWSDSDDARELDA